MGRMSSSTNDGELDALMKRAREAFDALTPEQQRAHRREQAISWVYGEMGLERADRGLAELTQAEADVERRQIADAYDRKVDS